MKKILYNWGVGITIFIVLFIIITVSFVIYSTTLNIDLVEDNYYENEINYQQQIDKISRSKKLEQKIIVHSLDKAVLIEYPNIFDFKEIKGKINFYRPSEKKLDFITKVEPDTNGKQIVQSSNFIKGLWRVKFDWSVGDTSFYDEQILMMN